MAETVTAAMWAVDMAELTGCDETIWVNNETILPRIMPAGAPVAMTYPTETERDALELRLRGGMAGHTMYAVPLLPGVAEPWACPGLLLTDDPGTAYWFAGLPGAAASVELGGDCFFRVLHLSHSSTQALAALPEEHTLWALGADINSICRAVSLGLASYEGRWGDWLTVPMTAQNGIGLLGQGEPHWLRIGPDGKLWAMDPWAPMPPTQGLDALVAPLPCADVLYPVDWMDMVLYAAMEPALDGVFAMERWYHYGICTYINQWEHTEDIVPRLPKCYVGSLSVDDLWKPLPMADAKASVPPAAARAAALLQRLTRPGAGTLSETLKHRLEKIAKPEKNT